MAGHPCEGGVDLAPKVLILEVGIYLETDIKFGRYCALQPELAILILAIAFKMWIIELKMIDSNVDLLPSLQIKTSQ